jgi:hypothetical protein
MRQREEIQKMLWSIRPYPIQDLGWHDGLKVVAVMGERESMIAQSSTLKKFLFLNPLGSRKTLLDLVPLIIP